MLVQECLGLSSAGLPAACSAGGTVYAPLRRYVSDANGDCAGSLLPYWSGPTEVVPKTAVRTGVNQSKKKKPRRESGRGFAHS